MKFPLIIVDAFTLDDRPFTGNGAAICILQFDDEISDETKQKMAAEFNLSETTFVAKAWNKDSKQGNNTFTIRWFCPTTEMRWCGHATLASARVIFDKYLSNSVHSVKFETKYKDVIGADIDSNREQISLDFPLIVCEPIDMKTNPLIENIVQNILSTELTIDDITDVQYSEATNYLLICLKDGNDLIWKVSPDFNKLSNAPKNDLVCAVIVTQKCTNENNIHFYTRVFAPWLGVNEDPVCGSAHAVLAPYWNRKYEENGAQLGKLVAKHCSNRGGIITCKISGDRVHLSGKTRIVVDGKITI